MGLHQIELHQSHEDMLLVKSSSPRTRDSGLCSRHGSKRQPGDVFTSMSAYTYIMHEPVGLRFVTK